MRKYALLIFLCCITTVLFSQIRDLSFKKKKAKYDIPFELENNFILVEVLFNGVFPLRFIFDTGAEHTILAKREITDLLAIDYTREFTLVGADMKTELYAYLAPGVSLQIKDVTARNRTILVLEDDYFKFEAYTGINIHGILGADFFRRFIVEINYRKEVITLHDPEQYKGPKSKFTAFPVEINRNKPYIYADALLNQEDPTRVKLLMDTGASLPLMLYTTTHEFLKVPSTAINTNIGMGLGGSIEGYVGRVEKFILEPFELGNVITSFQELDMIIDSSYLNGRNGILGNQILKRFNVVLDYFGSKLYLKPNRKFSKKFKYDKSGLIIITGGQNLTEYQIIKVVEGSPAGEAGLKKGDIIKSINGLPADVRGLANIIAFMKKKSGKKVKITVLREEEKMKFTFRLRDLFVATL